MRHAIAEERVGFAGTDAERALTEEGARRFRRAARALAAQVPDLALVVSSPYRRAVETAALLRAAFERAPASAELAALAPDGEFAAVLAFLRAQRRVATLALVGHEPSLSRLEGHLLTDGGGPLAHLKKGGAALVELAGVVAAGRGTLLWHLTAAQLRGLAP